MQTPLEQAIAGDMTDRTALVIGASTGIGAAIAEALLVAGATVHGVARRPPDEWSIPSEPATTHRYRRHILDVTNQVAVETFLAELLTTVVVDTLILAVGTNIPNRSLDRIGPSDWDHLMAVNLNGPFYVARYMREHLRAAGGDVVVVASVSALWPDQSGAAYQASKAGLLALARTLAAEEHEHGVRVTTILPGMVNTPLLDKRPEPPPSSVRARLIQPEDVARACMTALTTPRRTTIAEITLLPSTIQSIGHTG